MITAAKLERRPLVASLAALAATLALAYAGPLTLLAAPAAPPTATDPVLVGAGDIASCSNNGARETARLIEAIPGTVFTVGDNAYESGSEAQFRDCYDPTWGRFKSRTLPSPGNHDYVSGGAAPYFRYFSQHSAPPKGYYSVQIGAWHVVLLNSEVDAGAGSAQERWLKADLTAHPARCTLAIWHRPRFSSGLHGSDPRTAALWRALYAAGADLVVNGHDHDYERFAPQDPDGRPDPARGLREIVVGTGGANLRPFWLSAPNSEVRDRSTWGVLKLSLHPAGFDWAFVPTTPRGFRDAGSAKCHGARSTSSGKPAGH